MGNCYSGRQKVFLGEGAGKGSAAGEAAELKHDSPCRDAVVRFATENDKSPCPGYLTHGGNPTRGVVFIQEWWGVNPQIKRQAYEWFQEGAAAGVGGFATLVPDLYRGKVATDHEHAGHLMGDLDWQGAVADIAGAAAFLKNVVGCKSVGVVGFCMGGALSLASSVLSSQVVDAASVFYGIPGKQLADPANVKVPLILHFGADDDLAGFSDAEAQNALEATLKGVPGNKYTFYRYKGAGHAFCNDQRDDAFNKAACDLGRERTVDFFAKELKA